MSAIYREIDQRFLGKDFAGAMRVAEFALAQNAADTSIYRAIARIHHANRNFYESEKWFTALINHSEPRYQDYLDRSLVRNELCDYPGVIQDLNVAELMRNDDPSLYLRRGGAYWEMRDWNRADADFARTLKLNPNNPDAIWVNGLFDLQVGRFSTGWERYNARWRSDRFKSNRLITKKPEWSPTSGLRRVLVWGEQGVGDQILYASMLPELRSRVDKVTMLVDPRLVSLFSRSMPDINFLSNISKIPIDEHDSHLPIANIGAQFINSLNDIPKYAARNYLKADPARMRVIESKLQPGFTAVSWTSAAIKIGPHKSISIEDMEPILQIPDRRFVNVQYVTSSTEQRHPRIMHTNIDCRNDFEGLAALLSLSDCLVSVSSSTVHLAGALGIRVHLADANKLWYWGNKDGDQSLWYPSVKVYPRDNILAPWTNVIDRIRKDMEGNCGLVS